MEVAQESQGAVIIPMPGVLPSFSGAFRPGTLRYKEFIEYRNLVDSGAPLGQFIEWASKACVFSNGGVLTLLSWIRSTMPISAFHPIAVRMTIEEVERNGGCIPARMRRILCEEVRFQRPFLVACRDKFRSQLAPATPDEVEEFNKLWRFFVLAARVGRRSQLLRDTVRREEGSGPLQE